jgi:hypothetical protein
MKPVIEMPWRLEREHIVVDEPGDDPREVIVTNVPDGGGFSELWEHGPAVAQHVVELHNQWLARHG